MADGKIVHDQATITSVLIGMTAFECNRHSGFFMKFTKSVGKRFTERPYVHPLVCWLKMDEDLFPCGGKLAFNQVA